MNYSFIMDDWVWSYSRIHSYELCKYGWFLKYIAKADKNDNFFAQFGSFMHEILAKYINKELEESQLVSYYLLNYQRNITSRAPSSKIALNTFRAGVEYFTNKHYLDLPTDKAEAERKIDFKISDLCFTGYIDLISGDHDSHTLTITDHKSRELSPRTAGGKKRKKSDDLLDEYERQLYIYSTSILDEFNIYPDMLQFNCFKSNTLIKEPFDIKKYEETQRWAVDTVNEIKHNEDWSPSIDYFKCRYLCDMRDSCEYYKLS